jgi:hypothetical protein
VEGAAGDLHACLPLVVRGGQGCLTVARALPLAIPSRYSPCAAITMNPTTLTPPLTPVQEQSTEQGRSAMNWPAMFQEKQTGVVRAVIELGAMQC